MRAVAAVYCASNQAAGGYDSETVQDLMQGAVADG